MERLGTPSAPPVLMFGPKSTGGPQGASVLARCETQMSAPPRPPGRTPGGGGEGEEVMYRLRPSLEIAGLLSLYGELTTGPRFIGAPHGPYCGCSPAASAANFVEAEGPITALSDAHAWASAASTASRMILSIGCIGHLPVLIALLRNDR